jgi:Cu2+-exporting ATPase
VAQAIVDAGMERYYAQRTALPGGRAEPVPDIAELAVYDSEALQAAFLNVSPADRHGSVCEVNLMLEGVTCAACLWLNERHLAAQAGVLAVEVNFSTHRARVRWDPTRTRLSRLLQAVAAIGYRAHPFDASRRDTLMQRERRTALWRFLVAGLSSMQVMMYAVPVYLASEGDMGVGDEQLIRWASLVLTLPAIVYSSAHFFRNAWRDLRLRRLSMDVPVALGIAVAFAASVWATVTSTGEVYFDSVTMFVFLLLGGRYLELRVRQRASDALDRLSAVVPAVADHLPDWPDGRRSAAVAVASLAVGDVVSVAPGAVIPVDGVVVEGDSAADESLLTGESLPVPKMVGASVTGGSINLQSPLLVRVARIGAETTVQAIVRLLDRALSEKPHGVVDADRLAGGFVAGILVAAALTCLAWLWIDASRALWVAVSVLVVTCPCALALATPAALTASTTRLARQGVLVVRGHALETLARVTDVVFDKTGTLTRGRLRLRDVVVHGGLPAHRCHALAASLERGSRHPVALALLDEFVWDRAAAGAPGEALPVADARHHTGLGVEGTVDGLELRLGSADWLADGWCMAPLPAPETVCDAVVVYLANRSTWFASFVFEDELRDDAAATVQALREAGCRVHLLSGDQQAAVEAVAVQLSITEWVARATPESKLKVVQSLQGEVVAAGESSRCVLMVGDGVNDAPVLAAANVSLAVASASDAAGASADGLLLSGRLADIAVALRQARMTRRIIRQNLAWAMVYNCVAIPLAAGGLVNPWLAGLGMAGSSALVVGNAFRLSR